MKKLFGLGLAMMLGISMVGCADTSGEQVEVKEETKIEEQVEKEEVKEPEFDMDEFNKYLTTPMSEDEYETYFNSIEGQELEFDVAILDVSLREGYDYMYDILFIGGDYSEDNANVYLKAERINRTQLYGSSGDNVKIKARIEGYNRDYGWVEIYLDEITER